MDDENNGKPYCLMDDLGGKPHYFWKHPCEQKMVVHGQIYSDQIARLGKPQMPLPLFSALGIVVICPDVVTEVA